LIWHFLRLDTDIESRDILLAMLLTEIFFHWKGWKGNKPKTFPSLATKFSTLKVAVAVRWCCAPQS
jgi:hypothetical protein